MASEKLQGKRIAFVVAPEGTEQVELTEPWKAVEAAGGSPELLSTDAGSGQGDAPRVGDPGPEAMADDPEHVGNRPR